MTRGESIQESNVLDVTEPSRSFSVVGQRGGGGGGRPEDTRGGRGGVFIQAQPVFASDKVRYVGEEIAAVAAANLETAREALELIEVEWEELPPIFDPELA